MSSKITPKSLSAAFEELEKIAEEFEDETIDLEGGIAKLEKGLSLAAFLKKELSKMENKVVRIKEKYQEIDD
ncbi:MAG: exodeoxyribonuclease VII small subunit [Candidatus Shapirobacteria bacterium]|nr:exodeoxyribonuclease VII small subunit [Candidatus Shapirobacteria bacterium]MDD5073837.1 exodeoxyribonuclease VII small subunit [Candidatus Shapirobacteria bacterium]MDD5481817.1 exodeoxyribonuclease VII small subunit [Candidatus Shapirobacteria bacterium]